MVNLAAPLLMTRTQILAFWRAADAVHRVTDTLEDIRGMVGRESVAFILAITDSEILGSIFATFDGWGAAVSIALPAFRSEATEASLSRGSGKEDVQAVAREARGHDCDERMPLGDGLLEGCGLRTG